MKKQWSDDDTTLLLCDNVLYLSPKKVMGREIAIELSKEQIEELIESLNELIIDGNFNF